MNNNKTKIKNNNKKTIKNNITKLILATTTGMDKRERQHHCTRAGSVLTLPSL